MSILLLALSLLFTVILPVGSALLHAAKLDGRSRAVLSALRLTGGPDRRAAFPTLPRSERGELDVFIRGPASRPTLEAAGARVRTTLPGLCTAYVPADALDRVASLPGVTSIRLAAPAEPELAASVPTTGASLLRGLGPAFAGLNGAGVLVGSVDTGVDVDHGDFRDVTGGTRLVGLWDQIAPGTGDSLHAYGRMWTRAQIDAGLCTEADSVGHGSHVLGIAAGDGSQSGGSVPAFTHVGMAPRADLALVKSAFSTTAILDGVSWLFDLAAALGEAAVVNLSIGTHYGPHDGSSDLEQGLSALMGPGRIVVKSAGNDRGAARHAETNASANGGTITLSVTGSALGRMLAIDGYYDATERMRVRIVSPGGSVIGPIELGDENAGYPGQSTSNGTVYMAHDSLSTGRRNVYLEIGAATAAQSLNGTWTITFLADQLGTANGLVDLWRYYSSTGLVANFVAGNQPTRELISEPGNAADVITVGSYATRTSWTACNGVSSSFSGAAALGHLSAFSSPGPTRDGRQKPDLVAPGEVILSATSFDLPVICPGAGTPSAFADDAMNHTAMRGTSMAAPHVTGAVALLLQKRGALTPAQVKSYLTAHARRDALTGASPGNDWGFGKLDLGDLVDPIVSNVALTPDAEIQVGQTLELMWSSRDSLGSVASVDLMLSRDGPDGTFEAIASGVPNSGAYDWLVTGPPSQTGACFVRVVAHDTNGNTGSAQSASGFTIQGALGVAPPTGMAFALGPIHPNPASGSLRVSFTVARDAPIRLNVLDLAGRRVATLASGPHATGRHEARWDLTNHGVPIRPGLYFIAYETPAGTYSRRLAIAR